MTSAAGATCDVAVIGAGAAGIGAARRLQAAGLDVRVIEARLRPGGRAVTEMHEGFPLDLGCGWLHSADENPLVDLARAEGLTVDTTLPPWQRAMPEIAFPIQEQRAFRAAMAEFYDRLAEGAAQAEDGPADRFLELGSRWTPLMHAVSTYVNGCELDKLSTRDFDRYHDTELNYRLREGYGALFLRLARDLPVTYDCSVRRIDHSRSPVRIETTHGDLDARAVVLCVSTNILATESIEIWPQLPRKIEAAAALPLGLADKLYLYVDGAEDLPEDIRFFGRRDRAETGGYHLRPYGYPIIEGYYGGACARALEAEGLAGFTSFAIDEICGIFGNAWRSRLRPLAASRWGLDPFALGSYSHARPGHWDKRAVLAEPVDNRLFFAGEATSPHFFSTAHGAFESGLRAADEAMQALSGKSLTSG